GLAPPAFGEDVRPLLQRNSCPLGVVIQYGGSQRVRWVRGRRRRKGHDRSPGTTEGLSAPVHGMALRRQLLPNEVNAPPCRLCGGKLQAASFNTVAQRLRQRQHI